MNNPCSFDSIGNAYSMFSSFVTSMLVVVMHVSSIGKNILNPLSLYIHRNKYIFTIIWTPKIYLQLDTRAAQSPKYACRETLYFVVWQFSFLIWKTILLHFSPPKYFPDPICMLCVFSFFLSTGVDVVDYLLFLNIFRNHLKFKNIYIFLKFTNITLGKEISY